jgi:hypothetical protein
VWRTSECLRHKQISSFCLALLLFMRATDSPLVQLLPTVELCVLSVAGSAHPQC